MEVSARDHVQTRPTPHSVPRVRQRYAAWAAVLGRRLVIGLGMLAVAGVESPGTWLALAGVAGSYALEGGLLHRWEGVSEWVVTLVLGGAGYYAILLLWP